jgi:hypothetical protein
MFEQILIDRQRQRKSILAAIIKGGIYCKPAKQYNLTIVSFRGSKLLGSHKGLQRRSHDCFGSINSFTLAFEP